MLLIVIISAFHVLIPLVCSNSQSTSEYFNPFRHFDSVEEGT